MARVNVYLPDELARAARDAGLNVSSMTQQAISDALARRSTDAWLDALGTAESALTPADVLDALDAVREEELGG
jgi:post-segregation antitoxin (ccd killing protein)